MPSTHIDLAHISQIVTPVIEGARYELVDLEWKRELGAWVLRLYIDKPGGPHAPGEGITLDACAEVSQELSTVLDVSEAMPVAGSYQLEVGSPGIDRPLRRATDFQRAVGKKIKLRTRRPLGEAPGRRNYAGVLTDVKDADADTILSIDVGDRVCEVPLAELEKANLIADLGVGLGNKNHGRNGSQRLGSR
jgi:ribosome maturation factor RimP